MAIAAIDPSLDPNSFNWAQYQTQDATIAPGTATPGGLPASGNTGINGAPTGQVQTTPFPTMPVPSGGFGPPDPYGTIMQDLASTQRQARYREALGLPPTPPPGWQWNAQNPAWGQAQQYSANQMPSTSGSSGTSGQTWDQNYFTQNFGTPRTPQELVALESKITAAGGKVLRNASGVAGKIQTPDGRIIDVINSAGTGGNGFQWLEGPGGGGSASNPLSSLGYSFGDSMQKFQDPTAQQALDSPGLQFALSEANRMAQNGAAAKGTLLNGRFQQALSASNIGNALQGYGDVYNRAYQTFTRNQDAPWAKQLSLATLGKPGSSQ